MKHRALFNDRLRRNCYYPSAFEVAADEWIYFPIYYCGDESINPPQGLPGAFGPPRHVGGPLVVFSLSLDNAVPGAIFQLSAGTSAANIGFPFLVLDVAAAGQYYTGGVATMVCGGVPTGWQVPPLHSPGPYWQASLFSPGDISNGRIMLAGGGW